MSIPPVAWPEVSPGRLAAPTELPQGGIVGFRFRGLHAAGIQIEAMETALERQQR